MLAALFRGLVAIRFNLFRVLAIVQDRRDNQGDDSQGLHGHDGKACGPGREVRMWRAGEAVWIAGADVVLAGVSYLL